MTASRYDLLPPNATQLERDFSRAISPLPALTPQLNWALLGENNVKLLDEAGSATLLETSTPISKPGGAVPIIRTAKRTSIPDSVVPWLIYEYGLGEILPYLGNNQRRAIEEGVLWQRIRGTREAVRVALSWINITGLVEESEGGTYRWAEYQLGLSAGTTGEQIITDIVGVTRISSPVRSRLQRIYAVYDFRRFVLDDSLLSDGGMLSDHSGVRPRPDWPQISYGQIHSALVTENATVSGGHTAVISLLVRNFDRFLLDHSLIDEEWHTINHPALLTTQEGVSARYLGQTWAPATWGPRVVASNEVVLALEVGGALLLEDGEAMATEEHPEVTETWNDVNVIVSTTHEATYDGVFALEAGGSILAEDARVLALEDYPT